MPKNWKLGLQKGVCGVEILSGYYQFLQWLSCTCRMACIFVCGADLHKCYCKKVLCERPPLHGLSGHANAFVDRHANHWCYENPFSLWAVRISMKDYLFCQRLPPFQIRLSMPAHTATGSWQRIVCILQLCFFQQFFASVSREDYLTFRVGFLNVSVVESIPSLSSRLHEVNDLLLLLAGRCTVLPF